MPQDSNLGAPQQPSTLTASVAALTAAYITAEQDLLAGVTALLTGGAGLAAVAGTRRLVARVVNGLVASDRELIPEVAAATIAPPVTPPPGAPGTPTPAGDGGAPFDFTVPHGTRAVEAVMRDLASPLDDVKRRLTRLPNDVYKIVGPFGGGLQVTSGVSPAQAQAAAWREFTARGITGFTDRSGREWSMSAYTEMAVRTTATRAFNESHLQVMEAAGIDLYTVTDTGHPCPLCQPWQHRILSREPNPAAAATLDEARAAGLWHNNCRHVLVPVIPGVTRLPEPKPWTAEDQRLYDLTQKQRRLELEIRKAKRVFEYARTGEARQAARADVRRAQARMRAFIDETGFLRRSRREQLDLANATTR